KTESVDLAEYISDYIKADGDVWIGLNDADKNRVWVWTDRSSTDYLAWGPGEPNNQQKNEYCVELIAGTGKPRWGMC
ncbi:putative Venom C-type lectin mannose binding isoform 1 variant 3 protein, partial [Naja naja]